MSHFGSHRGRPGKSGLRSFSAEQTVALYNEIKLR